MLPSHKTGLILVGREEKYLKIDNCLFKEPLHFLCLNLKFLILQAQCCTESCVLEKVVF